MESIFFEDILLQTSAFIPQEKKIIIKRTGFFFWNVFYFVCLFWIFFNIFLRHQRNNTYFSVMFMIYHTPSEHMKVYCNYITATFLLAPRLLSCEDCSSLRSESISRVNVILITLILLLTLTVSVAKMKYQGERLCSKNFFIPIFSLRHRETASTF